MVNIVDRRSIIGKIAIISGTAIALLRLRTTYTTVTPIIININIIKVRPPSVYTTRIKERRVILTRVRTTIPVSGIFIKKAI